MILSKLACLLGFHIPNVIFHWNLKHTQVMNVTCKCFRCGKILSQSKDGDITTYPEKETV